MPAYNDIARRAFDLMVADPFQPFQTGIFCNSRSALMMAKILDDPGIDPDTVRQCAIIAPPEFLYDAESRRPMMAESSRPGFSFRREARRQQGLAEQMDRGETITIAYGDYLFCSSLSAGTSLIVLNRDGSPIDPALSPEVTAYALHDTVSALSWRHHFAVAIHVQRDNGERAFMVIDPSLMSAPATMQQWKERQNCPEAVMAIADIRGMLRLFSETEADEAAARTVRAIALTRAIEKPFTNGELKIVDALTNYMGGRNIPSPSDSDFSWRERQSTKSIYRARLAPLLALQKWKQEVIAARSFSSRPLASAQDRPQL